MASALGDFRWSDFIPGLRVLRMSVQRIRQNLAGVALVVTLCHPAGLRVKAVTSVPRFIERNVDPTSQWQVGQRICNHVLKLP